MTRDELVTKLEAHEAYYRRHAGQPAECANVADLLYSLIGAARTLPDALPPSEGSSLQDDVTFAIEARDYFRKDGLTGPIRSTFVMRNSVGDSVLYAVSYAGDVFVRGVVPVRATDTEPAKVVPIWKRLSDRVAVAESEGA